MKPPLFFKTIAVVTAVIFTATTIVWADPSFVYRVRIPEEYGKVRERWKVDSRQYAVGSKQEAKSSKLKAQRENENFFQPSTNRIKLPLLA